MEDSQNVHPLISRTSEYIILHCTWDFANVIKWRTFRWRDYPVLSGWPQCNCKHLYKMEARGSESEKKMWWCKQRLEGCENTSQGMKVAPRNLKVEDMVLFYIFQKECIPANLVCIENIQNDGLHLISVLVTWFLHWSLVMQPEDYKKYLLEWDWVFPENKILYIDIGGLWSRDKLYPMQLRANPGNCLNISHTSWVFVSVSFSCSILSFFYYH